MKILNNIQGKRENQIGLVFDFESMKIDKFNWFLDG
jgi:hypothetical protein